MGDQRQPSHGSLPGEATGNRPATSVTPPKQQGEREDAARCPTCDSGHPAIMHSKGASDCPDLWHEIATPEIAAVALAKRFHETYERLAPEYGYKTRKASAVPWEKVPEKNRRLMIAVAKEVRTATLLPVEQGEPRTDEAERLQAIREIVGPASEWPGSDAFAELARAVMTVLDAENLAALSTPRIGSRRRPGPDVES